MSLMRRRPCSTPDYCFQLLRLTGVSQLMSGSHSHRPIASVRADVPIPCVSNIPLFRRPLSVAHKGTCDTCVTRLCRYGVHTAASPQPAGRCVTFPTTWLSVCLFSSPRCGAPPGLPVGPEARRSVTNWTPPVGAESRRQAPPAPVGKRCQGEIHAGCGAAAAVSVQHLRGFAPLAGAVF